MNIFYLDKDPSVCAEQLCDKHVVKMATETAQIISTAYYIISNKQGFYKPTHKHHPCVLWATESCENLSWLYNYAMALGREYSIRYNNKRHLATGKLFAWKDNIDFSALPFKHSGFTYPPQCMPDKYRQANTVDAYRDYYKGEKLHFARWHITSKPSWIP